jgi:diaminopimelate epimerase
MRYIKYHGLGNDYIVLALEDLTDPLTAERIKRICDRNLGVGADGIVLYEGIIDPPNSNGDICAPIFKVRIYNPDGSEAETSGNGLRIAARYLADRQAVALHREFSLLTGGERLVTARVDDPQAEIEIGMGTASFNPLEIPVISKRDSVLGEELEVNGEHLTINCVNVGNPHCVILGREDPLASAAKTLGPLIERHPIFPRRINVQFAHVVDRSRVRIEIWERGAGYTLASGSSASAVVCVCYKLGLVGPEEITVEMPGGALRVAVSPEFAVTLKGPITKVCSGEISDEIFMLLENS